MPSSHEISVIVSTYQRPGHLRRCLTSLAAQRGVAGSYEVIVVDDGSQDETAELVAKFSRVVDFPLKWSTHPHDGFQLSRCRNSGIRAAVAPYILFTDGDCVFPLDHLRRHLDARRPGVARAGNCIRLDERTSARVDEDAVRSGRFEEWVPQRARMAMRWGYSKSLWYQATRRRDKPNVIGWNLAVWREQLEQINGFDERFRGWGCEDDDLASRLRATGARIASALGYTHGYHLWHPPHSTTPTRWHDGPNVAYFSRPVVLPRCLEGIRRRSVAQASVRVLSSTRHAAFSKAAAALFHESAKGPEIELLICPNEATFSADRAQRVVVVDEKEVASPTAEKLAHATLRVDFQRGPQHLLHELERLLLGERVGESTSTPAPARAA